MVDGNSAVAVVHGTLLKRRVMAVAAGDRELVAWLKPGAAAPLDRETVAGGRHIGATGVFIPVVDGRKLTFQSAPGGFRDEQTGSRWNVLGEAVAGPLKGQRLEPVTHVDTFWFAWAAFQPETQIFR